MKELRYEKRVTNADNCIHTVVYTKMATASAGSRTRIDCLEGNHANRYTTDARWNCSRLNCVDNIDKIKHSCCTATE